MIINLAEPILNLDGSEVHHAGEQIFDGTSPVTDNTGNLAFKRGKARTVGSSMIEALTSVYQDERDLPGPKKFERYQLAQKLYDKKSTDISVDDAKLIKDLVGKAYGPVILGPIFLAIEGSQAKKKKAPKAGK